MGSFASILSHDWTRFRIWRLERGCRKDTHSGGSRAIRRKAGEADGDRAHLSAPGRPVAIDYLAFPASVVLSAAIGRDWRAKAKAIEFRALDGYVSRIDAARLTSNKAYMASAHSDLSPFTLDNLAQNEKNLPLGPYYLVWDNREDPELLYEGARNWPYQVIDVSIFNASDAALRPPGFDPALEAGLSYLKANCLTCHKVNGFGGEKVEGNLCTRRARVDGRSSNGRSNRLR